MASSPEVPTIDDRWILDRRGPKNRTATNRPYAHLVEQERTAEGIIADVLTVFVTNRECPFRCLMCDLWLNTTDTPLPPGAVTEQIAWAVAQQPPTSHVKLYNAGSFFDPGAIPRDDWPAIAQAVGHAQSVLVECHPKLINNRCLEFASLLNGQLEMAMGLETVDPLVLSRLNKQMNLDDFERATEFLLSHNIPVRAFILLRPPFHNEAEGLDWTCRSLDWAQSIGVECAVIIPVRGGNGALDALAQLGHFHPPTLNSLERAFDHGLNRSNVCSRGRQSAPSNSVRVQSAPADVEGCHPTENAPTHTRQGRVFVDLWDIERLTTCTTCGPDRVHRLSQMNLTQQILPHITCTDCHR